MGFLGKSIFAAISLLASLQLALFGVPKLVISGATVPQAIVHVSINEKLSETQADRSGDFKINIYSLDEEENELVLYAEKDGLRGRMKAYTLPRNINSDSIVFSDILLEIPPPEDPQDTDQQADEEDSDRTCADNTDINDDGVVDILDLSILLSHWATPYCKADFNGDTRVDASDVDVLLSEWGRIAVYAP